MLANTPISCSTSFDANIPSTPRGLMSVKGDSVSCSINGTVVATYPKADVVAAGKLKSTDGVYGIRFAHNTDAVVSDLKVTKP